MIRTAPIKSKDATNHIQLLGNMVARAMIASGLGYQYGTDRDLYQALGYKTELQFEDYYNRYKRHDIAKAIIDRPVKASWQGQLELIESNQADETKFEKEWKRLNLKLGLKPKLMRVDRLTGIGEYGVLLLGLDDAKSPSDLVNPVKPGTRKLVYIRPFGQKNAIIDSYEDTPTNERYGMPKIYKMQTVDLNNNQGTEVKVHYSRIINIVDDPLESEIIGTPRLEVVFNRLMDLDKIVGGDAEMFWRGARPGYQGVVDKDFSMTQATKDALKDELDEMEHNLRRYFVNQGVEMKALAQQIADPSKHFDIAIQCISAVTGIPKRVLTGSERGELASSEDRDEWLTYVQNRREEHVEPRIVRPFVDRLIELGILPEPEESYMIDWADLFSLSEKQRVEIGKSRATALREYLTAPLALDVLSPKAFMEFCWGLTSQQFELINKMREDGEFDEVKAMEKLKEIQNRPVKPTPSINKE